MVGNYVPCYRKDTKEVGLYDIITNKWFSNKGSGTFSKGQDISRAVVITTLATTQDVDSLRTGDIEFSGVKSFKETIKSTVGNGKNAMTIGNGYLANSNGYLEIGYPNKAFRFYNDAIRSMGTLRPQTDNVDSLGTDINRYKNLYLSGNITNGSDVDIAVDNLVSTDTLNNYYTKDESNKLHQDLIEVAEGKAQTYVISVDAAAEGSTNAALKSEEDSLEVVINDTTFLQLTDGSNLLLKDVENGQIVLIKEINYPDRFIDIVEKSDEKPSKIKFHMLESRKVEIGNVVTTDTEQTITGRKIWLENLIRGDVSGRYLTIGESNKPWDKAFITYLNSP
jgi:hypothetical protein